jgi:hypothetical protein
VSGILPLQHLQVFLHVINHAQSFFPCIIDLFDVGVPFAPGRQLSTSRPKMSCGKMHQKFQRIFQTVAVEFNNLSRQFLLCMVAVTNFTNYSTGILLKHVTRCHAISMRFLRALRWLGNAPVCSAIEIRPSYKEGTTIFYWADYGRLSWRHGESRSKSYITIATECISWDHMQAAY